MCTRGERCAPGGVDRHVGTILEVPGREVGIGLQLVLGDGIFHLTIQLHLQPRCAVRHSQSLAECRRAGVVLLCRVIAIQINVRGTVVVSHVRETVDVPASQGIKRSVIHEGAVHVPGAVDVLGLRGAATGALVIGHHVCHAVRGVAIVDERHDRREMALYVVVIPQGEILRERWLQVRVTLGDVQRVGIVRDRQQVRHRGL